MRVPSVTAAVALDSRHSYEGWKQLCRSCCTAGDIIRDIPMRDGNGCNTLT